MYMLKAASLYFSIVFGAGFVLGTLRVLLLVPHVGERTAELIEMPLMLIVIVLAARWIVRHRLHDARPSLTILVGLLAMGLVLLADLGVGMILRDMAVAEVFLQRDPVSGTVYYLSLLVFAILPTFLSYWRQPS